MFRITVFFIFIAVNTLFAQTSSSFSIGERLVFHSTILNEDRVLNVYLPASYSPDSLNNYPTIYVLDGSIDEDIIHIAGLVQFASFSWINMIPESIVIGIANVDRKRDFTYPTSIEQDKLDFPTTGGSEKFISFIENELQSFVDERYRTNSSKTIIGQSLGGLLASEILLKKPYLFSEYIIVSPSIWWDNESLLDLPITDKIKEKSIYIAVGNEGKIMKSGAKKLFKKIKGSCGPSSKIRFEYFKAQNHGDALHLAVYSAFSRN